MAHSAQSSGRRLIAGWNREVGLRGGGRILPLMALVLAANYALHPAVHRHVDAHPQAGSGGSCASHSHPSASACCPHTHSKPHSSQCDGADKDRSGERGHSHCELCDGLIASTASPSWSASEPLLPTPSPRFVLQSQDDWTGDPSLLSSNLSRRGPPSASA